MRALQPLPLDVALVQRRLQFLAQALLLRARRRERAAVSFQVGAHVAQHALVPRQVLLHALQHEALRFEAGLRREEFRTRRLQLPRRERARIALGPQRLFQAGRVAARALERGALLCQHGAVAVEVFAQRLAFGLQALDRVLQTRPRGAQVLAFALDGRAGRLRDGELALQLGLHLLPAQTFFRVIGLRGRHRPQRGGHLGLLRGEGVLVPAQVLAHAGQFAAHGLDLVLQARARGAQVLPLALDRRQSGPRRRQFAGDLGAHALAVGQPPLEFRAHPREAIPLVGQLSMRSRQRGLRLPQLVADRREALPVSREVLLHGGERRQRRRALAPLGRQRVAVSRQVGLQRAHHVPQALAFGAPFAARAVEGDQLADHLAEPLEDAGRRRGLCLDRDGLGQRRVAERGDQRMTVDRRRVVGCVQAAVVEPEDARRERPQRRVVIEVHRQAHHGQPALQAAVTQRQRPRAGVRQPLGRRRQVRQAVVPVLLEVAVLQSQLVAQEALEQDLGLVDLRRLVRAGQHDPAPRHARALGHESRAVARRHVLERVEGRDHVERAVRERQRAAGAEHETLLPGRLHVDEPHAIARQERPQQRRAPADVQDRELLALPAQALDQVGDQAVALVLVEGQVERVGHHASDSNRLAPRPG